MRTVEELVQEFGKLDTAFRATKKNLLTLFTEEELVALRSAPRSMPMESGTKWCKIGGRSTYPCSFLLQPDELKIYNEYHSGKSGTSTNRTECSASPVSGNHISLEEFHKLQGIVTEIKTALGDNLTPELQEDVNKLASYIPKPRENLIYDLFGVYTAEQVPECTVGWIMFRSMTGERAENPMSTVLELVQQGYIPNMLLDQIKDKLQKLQAQGIDVASKITDLPQ